MGRRRRRPRTSLPIVTVGAGRGNEILFSLDLPIETFLDLYLCIYRLGVDTALRITSVGAIVASGLPLSTSTTEQLEFLFSTIAAQMEQEAWESPSDVILSCCYHMLHSHQMTRTEAAIVASRVLHEKFSVDSWRMRVDRWATSRNLPKVQLRTARRR